MASPKSNLSSLLKNFSTLGQDELKRKLDEAKWSSFSSLEFPSYNFSSLNWMNQMNVHQNGKRRIEEKNDIDGHFMEFLMHDQMDHFKPFTLICENGITKYQDVFSVQEGNGMFVVSPSHPDATYWIQHIGHCNCMELNNGEVINCIKVIIQSFMKLLPVTLSGPEKSKILLRSFANIKFQITEAHTKYCQESTVIPGGPGGYWPTTAGPGGPGGPVELVQFDDWMNKIIESSKLVCATQSIELKDDVKKLQDITENFGNGMKEMKIKFSELILALNEMKK